MKKTSSLLLTVVLTLGTALVHAGEKRIGRALVNPKLGIMNGSLGGTRNSTDAVQYLACQISYDEGNDGPEVWCGGSDQLGNVGSCTTSNPAMVQTVASMSGDSFIDVRWNVTTLQCTRIAVQHASWYAPKNP